MDAWRLNLKKYIGREYAQVNCWDLVREFYMTEFQIELPKFYSGITPNDKDSAVLICDEGNRVSFEKVSTAPTFGDLMPIKILGLECHIGIFIGEGKFLHSQKKTGSVLDNLDRWKHLITGYYRHRTRTA